jgi:serine/threonine protein kinase
MPLAAGTLLSYYEVLEPLGAGAMGEVYRARDTRLEREVALKILPEQFAQDDERLARFEREALILASVNHPNIGSIYSVEQVESTYFLVLELVGGETLAQRLERGVLAPAEARSVFVQIVEGTAAAHAQGVAHRDLKPANIVITRSGVAKVLDFGIAKRCGEEPDPLAAPRDPRTWTFEGRIIGTIPYMSPEQAAGGSVDLRSDLFSLGVLLFEMLSGELPFTGETPANMIAAILDGTPRSLPDVVTGVPKELTEIIARCLQKDPSRRYPSALELSGELGGLRGHDSDSAPAVIPISRPVVAVLPLRNLSADQEQEYFADGVTADIITSLSYWRWFPVIASNSTAQYKATDKTTKVIAQELGADYLVHGSILRAGARVRIHVELIDAHSEIQLWSQRFDREFDDIFALQDEITARVATTLEPELSRAERQRALRKPPGNLDAWDLCLKAMAAESLHTSHGLVEAICLLERALEIDPTFGMACSMLSSCRYFEAIRGWTDDTTTGFTESFELARRATELDAGDWLAHAKLGMGHMWTSRDFESAIEEVSRAVELNPSSAQARHCLSCVLGFSGKWVEAIPHLHAALRLDPRYHYRSSALADLSLAHLMTGEYERSVQFAEQAIRSVPSNSRAHQRLISALALGGEPERAGRASATLREIQPSFSRSYIRSTYPFRAEDDHELFVRGLEAAGLSL